MKILDATCGSKNMWFNKNHPLVTYMDERNGNYVHWGKKMKIYKKYKDYIDGIVVMIPLLLMLFIAIEYRYGRLF